VAAVNAGARVVSMSLGGNGYSPTLQSAVDYAWQNNVVVVAAAGNNASSTLFFPGGANHAIGVSATDINSALAGFSNFGNGVAVAAPGVSIISTFPSYSVTLGCCNYASLSGTSMATPFVSALAGLVAMTTPNTSAAAIQQRLEQSAATSVAGGAWSQSFGYGIINAYSAVGGLARATSTGGVVGQIVDSSGNTIPGAQVSIAGQNFTTDGSGLYWLRQIAAGTYPVTVSAAGFAAASFSVTVAPGADSQLALRMGVAYGSFTGAVTDRGAPVPYAIVQASSSGLVTGTAVADANGQYTLWVPAGTGYTLQASQVGSSSTAVGPQSAAAGASTTVNLTLTSLLGTIAGTVLDPTAAPVAGATVTVSAGSFSTSAVTSAAGAYAVGHLPPGTYTVAAAAAGYQPASQAGVGVTADNTTTVNLQFALAPAVAPIFSPAPGSYAGPQNVSIATSSPGASIRYTTDGSTPSASAGTLYTGPVTVNASVTLKAVAINGGGVSPVASATYTIDSSAWYNVGGTWAHRKAIRIDHTRVAGALANFPVLVSLTDANLAASAKADGSDILFTASDGLTKLNNEIDQYTSVSGRLIAWVNVPSLSATADTVVYVYYGNPTAASQQNAAAVWDASYKAVWHLKDGVTLSGAESTAAANTLANTAAAAIAGQVGGGASFNGTTQSMSSAAAVNLSGGKTASIEFWLNPTALSSVAVLLETSANFNSNPGAILFDPAGESGKWGFLVSKGDAANYNGVTLNTNPSLGDWHHVAVTIDLTAGTGQAVAVYIDGAPAAVTQGRTADLSALNLGNLPVFLMARNNSQFRQAGRLDEVRFSNSVRSAAWIATGYANQNAPAAFYAVGAEENVVASANAITVTSSPAGRTLTVDGVVCTAPCTFQWAASSNHTIAAATQAGAAGTQYAFAGWSDGGAASHTVTPATAATYTATFTTQYFLTTSARQAPAIAGCPAFPANSIWNTPVDGLPVAAHSSDYIASITATDGLRYDLGMPVNLVPGSQPLVTLHIASLDESDPGPYPIPPNAQVEPGDLHVIVVDQDHCVLYETYNSVRQPDGSWNVTSAAKWDLTSNALRSATWTSADAAGLPILPGLLRYDEVASGQITHALRFTAPQTQRLFVWPGRHYASTNTSPTLPAMGQRFRLKAGFDISGFSPNVQTILRAVQKYGLMLADNGLPWFLQAQPDPRWNTAELDTLRSVLGSNLEAVDVSGLQVGADSGQAVQPAAGAGGTIAPASGWFDAGSIVAVSAAAGGGYAFQGFSGALSGTASPRNLTMTGPASVFANFLSNLVSVTVASTPAGLALTVDGAACTSPCTVQWVPGSGHTIAAAAQAGGTGTQYLFASWSDGGAASHSVTGPATATSYTATFTTQYFLTTVASPASGGSIAPASGWFNAGTVVAVSAAPNGGFQFTGFSGALAGTPTPQNVTMNAPASVTAAFAAIGGPAWYSVGGTWTHRKAVTIDHTKVAGALANFPVLISVTDPNIAASAKSDGSDILFTAGDGLTKLNHEIDQYTSASGQLIAWVNVPSLSTSVDTVVYVYYGNPSAASQQNAAAVWDANYKAVWHLRNGVTLSGAESTAAGNALSTALAAASAGQVGGGASFNGTTQSTSSAAAVNLSGGKTASVEFWLNPTALSSVAVLLETSANFNANPGAILMDPAGESGKWGFLVSKGDGANYNGVTLNTNPTLGAWHHIAATINLAVGMGQAVAVFVDGAPAAVTQSRAADLSAINLGSFPAFLMARNNSQFRQAGQLDEVRFSNAVRSAAWIATEYSNQKTPASFYLMGAEENFSGGGGTTPVTVASVPAGLSLTVDGAACTSPCSVQWLPGSAHAIAAAAQAGGVGTQYLFASWSDSGAASHSVTGPATAITYTATFTTQYFLTTAANPAAGGSIAPASGWFNAGTVVPVSAAANSGFQFTGFSGALTGTATPQNVTINAPASVTAAFAAVGGTSWYSAGGTWAHRKAVTINHTKVAGALANFPVLLSVTDANIAASAKLDGFDILFTMSDGVTKLNHEIDQYTSASGQLIAWVNVPSLSSTADTVVYVYYGNPAAASQQNAAAVWDANYKAVWHLRNGVTLSGAESTAAANALSTVAAGATAGQVGGGASFNGTSQSMSSAAAVNLSGGKTASIEFWLNPTALSSVAVLLETSANFNSNPGAILLDPAGETGGKWGFLVSKGDGANYNGVTLNTSPAPGAWHHIAATINLAAGTGQAVAVFIDGAPAAVAQNRMADLSAINLGSFPAFLMARNNSQFRQAGQLDEVRFSNAVRSAAWIATEYSNQKTPASFYLMGAEETFAGGAGIRSN
jgi:hypothetical protein